MQVEASLHPAQFAGQAEHVVPVGEGTYWPRGHVVLHIVVLIAKKLPDEHVWQWIIPDPVHVVHWIAHLLHVLESPLVELATKL